MQYNRLTKDELERLVYVEPNNAAAAAELLRRVPSLMDQEDEDLQEAKQQVEHLESEVSRAEEISEKVEAECRAEINNLAADLAIANARIAALTYAEDLV